MKYLKSTGFFAICLLFSTILSACTGSSSTSSSQDASLSSESSYEEISEISEPIPEPTIVTSSCEYDVSAIERNILNKGTDVIQSWTGNVWLNFELEQAIWQAENVANDPSCQEDAESIGLSDSIDYEKEVLAIGQSRVEKTTGTANSSLSDSFSGLLDSQ